MAAEVGEDLTLHDGVDRAGGVVEHEQPGRADEGAGQRDPLPLAAGEGHAPFPHHRGAAVGQCVHEGARSR